MKQAKLLPALAKQEGYPQKLLLMPMTWDPGKAQNAAAAAQKLLLPGTKLLPSCQPAVNPGRKKLSLSRTTWTPMRWEPLPRLRSNPQKLQIHQPNTKS